MKKKRQGLRRKETLLRDISFYLGNQLEYRNGHFEACNAVEIKK